MEETTLRPIQFRLRTILIVTAACAVVSFFAFTGPTSSTVFSSIEVGMSRDEVLAILGEPDETLQKSEHAPEKWRYRRDWIDWFGEDRYSVYFDDQGTVAHTGPESWFRGF